MCMTMVLHSPWGPAAVLHQALQIRAVNVNASEEKVLCCNTQKEFMGNLDYLANAGQHAIMQTKARSGSKSTNLRLGNLNGGSGATEML